MRQEVMKIINNDKIMKQYIRENPIWYRKLTRNPSDIEKLSIDAINFYEQTIPHKVAKFANGAQMASMLLTMFQTMNDK